MTRNHDVNAPKQVLGQGRFARLVSRDGWEWAERTTASGIVVIVAVTEARELLVVEQFRPPVARRVLELPAGLAGDIAGLETEALIDAARRELEEETGFQADDMRVILEGPVSAGLCSEVITLFYAPRVRRVGPGGGAGDEDIQLHLVPLATGEAWLADRQRQGTYLDPKVLAGFYLAAGAR